nr:hypothetical protein [Tanacetum cinerariifolium]
IPGTCLLLGKVKEGRGDHGGGGVECRVGKGGEWGWREFWVGGMNSTYFKKRGKMVLCRFWGALHDAIAESLAGVHEKERHVAKLDLND